MEERLAEQGMHLQRRVVVCLHQPGGVVGQLLGRVAIDGLVDAHLVAALAAHQLVDRYAKGLTLDVPQGMLDAADGRVEHGATGEA